eukprot:CAMPEP_0177629274 /NCGR_PEP_ID=MMETSP0447-20121125/580_1 /TAXON_ID=0 /ORGANISM="Stygamoeba regulata, Strain BSH-02190019" /LENGTH=205 /DNA_ID=CAMNT_0019130583 /DNA_START=39 /DNA_END=656 /DNA_ORIENTATION=-
MCDEPCSARERKLVALLGIHLDSVRRALSTRPPIPCTTRPAHTEAEVLSAASVRKLSAILGVSEEKLQAPRRERHVLQIPRSRSLPPLLSASAQVSASEVHQRSLEAPQAEADGLVVADPVQRRARSYSGTPPLRGTRKAHALLGRVDPTTRKLSAVLGIGEELIHCAHHESRMLELSVTEDVSGLGSFEDELILDPQLGPVVSG